LACSLKNGCQTEKANMLFQFNFKAMKRSDEYYTHSEFPKFQEVKIKPTVLKQCVLRQLTLAALFILVQFPAYSQQISIAAAADLRYAMDEIAIAYKQQNPNIKIQVTYGSSGKFYQQLVNNAPFDVFFSADMLYAQKLYEQGKTMTPPKLYAYGYIVVWSNKIDPSGGIPTLINPSIKKIAIATPAHAPYGKRAEECLIYYNVYDKVKRKLVFAENIAQTAQFVQSGNAEIGIIALSLALSPALQKTGRYYLIDQKSYTPLKQAYVVLKNKNAAVSDFVNFIATPLARNLLKKYGFSIPEEK